MRSLLDPVADVTARIREGNDAFLSQSTVLIAELVTMLGEDTQGVRVTGAFAEGTPAVESTEVDDLSLGTQQTRRVLADTHYDQKLTRARVSRSGTRCSALGTRGAQCVTRRRAPTAGHCSRLLSVRVKSTHHAWQNRSVTQLS